MSEDYNERSSEEPFWQGYLDGIEVCALAVSLTEDFASKQRLMGELKAFMQKGGDELIRSLNEFNDLEALAQEEQALRSIGPT